MLLFYDLMTVHSSQDSGFRRIDPPGFIRIQENVVCGVVCRVFGVWCVVSWCVCCVLCGVWRVVCGVWRVVRGVWGVW
jgi:hypothetical protein